MKIPEFELIVILLALFTLVTRHAAFAQSNAVSIALRNETSQTETSPSLNRGGATLGANLLDGEQDANDYFKRESDSSEALNNIGGDPGDYFDSKVADVQVNSQELDVGDQQGIHSEVEAAIDDQPLTESFQNIINNVGASWLGAENGWFGRENIGATIKTILVTSTLVVAPAILLMTTSYVRVSVVLLLLRQALGIGQIPSNQIIAALSVVLTALIMTPVGKEVYQNAVVPFSEEKISRTDAFKAGQEPVRTFLWTQIERTGNADIIGIFTKYLPDEKEPRFYEDIPWRALAPAFLLSELKTAFLIGFQVFLPFLIIDLVVSCVLVSTGMMMLPPAIVSLPFKLALFVMVDGWSLVVKSLLESFS